MKKTKIIHLAGPVDRSLTRENAEGAYYIHSWAATIASRTKSRYPGLDIETWRTDWHTDRISPESENGCNYLLFPKRLTLFNEVLSGAMCLRLRKLAGQYNLIVNYHDAFGLVAAILPLLVPQARIVLFHHGGLPPLGNRPQSLLKRIMFSLAGKRIAFATYLNRPARDFLEQLKLRGRMGFIPVGADYQRFAQLDKQEARRQLGLDQDCVIAVGIGAISRQRGYDLVCEVYRELKARYNFQVILIGPPVPEEEALCREAEAAGICLTGRIPWTEVHKYLSACDFYLHPVFDEAVGFDVSLLEALASDRPVISTRIGVLQCSPEELGILLKDRGDLLAQTDYMVNNYNRYKEIRSKTIGLYDANSSIIDSICQVYVNNCGMAAIS